MDKHGLSTFKLKQDDTNLELKKGGDIDIEAVQRILASSPVPQAVQAPPVQAVAQGSPVAPVGGTPAGNAPAPGEAIVAPMVGTLYTAPDPEAEAYVKVGDKVEADTVVCIIEAMKVMNEIKAEVSGEIVEILVDNGSPVQFEEPLFRIKPS